MNRGEGILEEFSRGRDRSVISPEGSGRLIEALEQEYVGGDRLVALNYAAEFLVAPAVSNAVWEWLIVKAESANADQRIALAIGVFELLTDEPEWRAKLFSLLPNRRLWWIFVEVYERKPSAFYSALQSVCEQDAPSE